MEAKDGKLNPLTKRPMEFETIEMGRWKEERTIFRF